MRETEKIWMNGELVDWADARIHVGAHGLHYGSGVFEGIRAYETDKGSAVFRLTDHLKRLAQLGAAAAHGAAVLGRGAARGLPRADRAPTGCPSATCARSRSSATASSASRRSATRSTS